MIYSLGFRRLSIIDIENGHQPLFMKKNGKLDYFQREVYNYIELRVN